MTFAFAALGVEASSVALIFSEASMSCERLASPVHCEGDTTALSADRKSRLSALGVPAIDGPSGGAMPTLAFRLGLALRRCGEVDAAEAYFRWSRRLMAERYVAARIGERRRFVLADAAGDPSAPGAHAV
jgi:hypothetical protein